MQNTLKLAKQSKKGKFSVIENMSIPEEFASMKVKLTDHECQVIEMLKQVADQNGEWKDLSEKSLDTIDDLYSTITSQDYIRDYLNILNIDKKVEDKSEKKIKRVDEIRQKNTFEKMKSDMETLKSLFLSKSQESWKNKPSSSYSEPIEIKLLKLMYHIECVRKNYENIPEEFIYDLAFGCSKIISKLDKMEVKHKTQQKILSIKDLQNTVVDDMKKVYKRFLEDIEFDVLHAAHNYPRFFIRTSYDTFLPGLQLSPYPSQLETIQFIYKHRTNGFLLWLNTLTGEGKTSLVVSIAQLAMNLSSSSNKDIKVIYCCSNKLKTIRHQVGQYTMKGAIPFCLMDYDKINKKVVTTSIKSAKNSLIIADIDSTISLLSSEENNKDKYILFFDEPTFELDKENSEMIPYLTRIFNVLPSMTILSTATAPHKEDIPRLETLFLNKYPNSKVEFICSTRVQIGSEICGFDGLVFLPHIGCKTRNELREVVEKIKKDGFLQKCYTANVVNALYNSTLIIVKKYKTDIKVENFSEKMKISGNMNQLTIQNLGLEYLELIASIASLLSNDEIVKIFCNIKFTKKVIDFEKLSENFSVFENQTLIVTEDPKDFFNRHFFPYLSNVEKDMGMLFTDMYKKYTNNMEKFKDMEKDVYESIEKLSKVHKQEREVLLQTRLNELYSNIPKLGIDEKYIIGSTLYFEEKKEELNGRTYIPPENIKWEEVVCEEKYQFALVLGIGIMAPSKMTPSYTQKVIELASKGLLAYVIADEDICYGTNYPFENVIVDECLKSHSVKTIFQVFARAGRPGKSWKANIFAHKDILTIIENYVFDPNYTDIETVHINISLDDCDIPSIPNNMTEVLDIPNNVPEVLDIPNNVPEVSIPNIPNIPEVLDIKDEVKDSWEDM